MVVPIDEVYGVYECKYPPGSEVLTLQRDGRFVQEIRINNESPTVVTGKWEFDPKESKVTLHGFVSTIDGFGELQPDWRKRTTTAKLSVEKHWTRIVIASGGDHPYKKQRS